MTTKRDSLFACFTDEMYGAKTMTTKHSDDMYGAFRLVRFCEPHMSECYKTYEVLKQGGMNEEEATELAAELHCQIEHQDPDSKIWYGW